MQNDKGVTEIHFLCANNSHKDGQLASGKTEKDKYGTVYLEHWKMCQHRLNLNRPSRFQ